MTDSDAIRALNHLFAQPRTLEAQLAWAHVQERLHELKTIGPCTICSVSPISRLAQRYAMTLSQEPSDLERDGWRPTRNAGDTGLYWRPCLDCKRLIDD